ncbi:MAG: PspC domain-containing protein [Legionellaceae bacterium]|nr:PspC domain-containing protein [Legionellaceae bacterium]MBP9775544.1 PspC domain-containing protein [Legionellaceae bacterium]
MTDHIKKLYRSKQDRMIAGVCMGLAEYFNIDPTIMRLGFVGFALAGGSALIIYALMWLIVPLKR